MKTYYLLRTSVWCRTPGKQISKWFSTKKELHDFCIKENLCFAFDCYQNIDGKKDVSVWRCF